MSFFLRPDSDCQAIILSNDYASILALRKTQLYGQLLSAQFELDVILPIKISQAQTPLEAQFIRALVIDSDAAPGSDPVATSAGGGGITFALEGNVVAGQSLGKYTAPGATTWTGLEMDVQAPDPGSQIIVALYDGGGVERPGTAVTAAAASKSGQLTFPSVLALSSGDVVEPKVKTYVPSDDLAAPAQHITLHVLSR